MKIKPVWHVQDTKNAQISNLSHLYQLWPWEPWYATPAKWFWQMEYKMPTGCHQGNGWVHVDRDFLHVWQHTKHKMRPINFCSWSCMYKEGSILRISYEVSPLWFSARRQISYVLALTLVEYKVTSGENIIKNKITTRLPKVGTMWAVYLY